MAQFPDILRPRPRRNALLPGQARHRRSRGVRSRVCRQPTDEPHVHLLLIDMQVDFCHENGSLYVPGAEGDIRRTIEFIYPQRRVDQPDHLFARFACAAADLFAHLVGGCETGVTRSRTR